MSNCLTYSIMQQYMKSDLTKDLVSVWEMNEENGTTMNDSHGTNDGTIGSAVTINQSGIIDKSYSYIKSNLDSGVIIPDNDDFSCTDGINERGLSISCWFKRSDISQEWLVNKRNGNVLSNLHEWQLILNNNNLAIAVHSEGQNNVFIGRYKVVSLSLNTWYHTVVTYNGNKKNNGCAVFLNGIRVDNLDNGSGTYIGASNTSATVFIGRAGWDNTKNLYGNIDQTAIWKRELNIYEVRALYNSGNGLAYSSW